MTDGTAGPGPLPLPGPGTPAPAGAVITVPAALLADPTASLWQWARPLLAAAAAAALTAEE
jgi:hypothetical protein